MLIFQTPCRPSGSSRSSTLTPMGRVPASRGWVAVSGAGPWSAKAGGFQVAAYPDLDAVWDCEADDLALLFADLQLGVEAAGDDHEFASGASDSRTPRLPGQTKGDKWQS